jgi:hypothetical protein
VLVFIWALKNGQFKEQQRARYLPLDTEMDTGPATVNRFHRFQAYLLFGLVFSGLLASIVFVVFVLVKSKITAG